MELLEHASQDAVVAAWLAAEIDSSRFSPRLKAILARDGQAVSVLSEPNIGSLPSTPALDRGVVVLEGHVRLIAYVMAGRAAPLMVDAFLGRSPTVISWPEY